MTILYPGPNGIKWYLTVQEYSGAQENSEGGVDTYPTFQPVNVRLQYCITIIESYTRLFSNYRL